MNKESIYRIIGYNGEYSANVKKAIRKLLKENHPDNNGDRRIFELISEVKKELEENRVSINYNKNNRSVESGFDIDYLYCSKMMDEIVEKRKKHSQKLDLKKKELATFISQYKNIYSESIDMETYLLSNSYYMEQLKNTKLISIILIILATIIFVISILTKQILLLGIFAFIVIICIIVIHRAFFTMQKITDTSRNKVKNYVSINTDLRDNQNKQKELKKEIHELSKTINMLDNDYRFYENIINNR